MNIIFSPLGGGNVNSPIPQGTTTDHHFLLLQQAFPPHYIVLPSLIPCQTLCWALYRHGAPLAPCLPGVAAACPIAWSAFPSLAFFFSAPTREGGRTGGCQLFSLPLPPYLISSTASSTTARLHVHLACVAVAASRLLRLAVTHPDLPSSSLPTLHKGGRKRVDSSPPTQFVG